MKLKFQFCVVCDGVYLRFSPATFLFPVCGTDFRLERHGPKRILLVASVGELF